MFGLCNFVKKLATSGSTPLNQQIRNTFILKRRTPLPLHKKEGRPIKMRSRHFVYELIQDTNVLKQPDVSIILKQFVNGVGSAGDKLTMRPKKAYEDFLLPGLAVYATPENVEKYKIDENKRKMDDAFSSPYVKRTIRCLSYIVLQITMSKTQPWVLEPWHIRASFRKSGFFVPEYAIEMPPHEIKGPDLTLQSKEFYITVTINKTEKVNVRCRIHHWATGLERLPWEENHWKKPYEALFPEQAQVLESMPLPK
ncbi:hypothetical protein K1T71_010774 [Dendrolimus kikuchii]|uniref:Uncharacterized protein n=1 Tax=Dendrolimus kikuchii TaxID=765133 RepID=A0ACC1CPW2_9NEOP|nr:hypothetical protein K1T71_010774 [Dendrolimus kikuchii]